MIALCVSENLIATDNSLAIRMVKLDFAVNFQRLKNLLFQPPPIFLDVNPKTYKEIETDILKGVTMS